MYIQKSSISFSSNKSLIFCENHSWFLKSNHKLVFIENKTENVPPCPFKPWRVKWKGVFSKPSRKWIVAIIFCLSIEFWLLDYFSKLGKVDHIFVSSKFCIHWGVKNSLQEVGVSADQYSNTGFFWKIADFDLFKDRPQNWAWPHYFFKKSIENICPQLWHS